MDDKLIQKTLEQIKDERIEPRPVWEHRLIEACKWLMVAFCGLVGAFGLVFVLNVLSGADWDVHPRLGLGILRFVMFALPPLWLIGLVTAVVMAYVLVRNTRYGYRYDSRSVVLMVFGLVAFIGTASFLIRADDFLERRIPRMMQGYGRVDRVQQEIWSNPKKGLLGGTVITFDNGSKSIALRDFQGQNWLVEIDRRSGEALPMRSLNAGKRIKVLGEMIGEWRFRAVIIRPWNDRFQHEMPGPMMRIRVAPGQLQTL